MTKDYYRILGVLDDAEDIVIKAAYRALAQKYHPDKWTGSSNESTARMVEINEAYAVLSDAKKREQYDSTREKSSYEDEFDDEDEILSSIESDWNEVVIYFPDLEQLSKDLSRISKAIEFTFKTVLLEKKTFLHRKEIAVSLENAFLQRFFGENKTIITFAKRLILDGNKGDAKKLNRAVGLLGSNVDPMIILNKIPSFANYNFLNANDVPKFEKKYLNRFEFAERFIKTRTISDGLKFLKLMGGDAYEGRNVKGLFGTCIVYYVTYQNLSEKMMEEHEFSEFIYKLSNDLLKG